MEKATLSLSLFCEYEFRPDKQKVDQLEPQRSPRIPLVGGLVPKRWKNAAKIFRTTQDSRVFLVGTYGYIDGSRFGQLASL